MSNGNFTPEPVTSKGSAPRSVKNASQGRVMSIKGPKSSVAKGNLSPRMNAPIVNGR